MHVGSIDRDTAAGRLYRHLRERPGVPHDAWALSQAMKTTCLSTRVSEVNVQLEGRGGTERVEHVQRERWHYYCLVTLGQMDLEGCV